MLSLLMVLVMNSGETVLPLQLPMDAKFSASFLIDRLECLIDAKGRMLFYM